MNFARVAEHLADEGYTIVAVAGPGEEAVLEELQDLSRAPMITFADLSLKEVTALAAEAELFVGNDSGIAHMAAAVGTPSVVVFGSSNVDHWRPWTDAPHEVVQFELPCQPCAGYKCEVYGEPLCIRSVEVSTVVAAVERVLRTSEKAGTVPAFK